MVDQRAAADRRDDERPANARRDIGQRRLPLCEVGAFQRREAFILPRQVGQ